MNLASYLEKHGLKSAQFAEKVGVPASTISRILSGERRPLFDTVVKISEATGGEVALSDFVLGEPAPSESDCPVS
jgi:transcriptional regulator with XRE-family HTH domain